MFFYVVYVSVHDTWAWNFNTRCSDFYDLKCIAMDGIFFVMHYF